MTKVVIDRFDGGLAETKYPNRRNVAADMHHCDIYTDPRLLKNHRALERDVNQSGSYEFYVLDAVRRSDGKILGVGYASSVSTQARFFRKNNDDITSYWQTGSVAAGNAPYYNGAIAFKDAVYCLSYSGTSNSIYRYDGDSNTTSMVSTFTESGSGAEIPKPIVHPQDGKLYMGIGKTVFVWDGSAGTVTTGITTPNTIVALSYWGTYVAIGCVDGQGRSLTYLWGRDTTITTFQEVIPFGDDRLVLLANLNGVLIGVSTRSTATTFLDAKVKVRGYAGGTPKLLKEYITDSTTNIAGVYTVWKDVLYFLDRNQSSPYPYLWSFHFNRDGEPALGKDRTALNDSDPTTYSYNFFNIHDYFFFANNTGKLTRTYDAQPLYSTHDSIYTFPRNTGIDLKDQPKLKRLSSVYVRAYANSAGYGTLKLEYSIDGGSFTTLFSETSPSGKNNYVVECLNDLNGDPLGEGRDIQFRLTFDQGIDIAEFGYDYEPVETTI